MGVWEWVIIQEKGLGPVGPLTQGLTCIGLLLQGLSPFALGSATLGVLFLETETAKTQSLDTKCTGAPTLLWLRLTVQHL